LQGRKEKKVILLIHIGSLLYPTKRPIDIAADYLCDRTIITQRFPRLHALDLVDNFATFFAISFHFFSFLQFMNTRLWASYW